jgi:hypothetical protein
LILESKNLNHYITPETPPKRQRKTKKNSRSFYTIETETHHDQQLWDDAISRARTTRSAAEEPTTRLASSKGL